MIGGFILIVLYFLFKDTIMSLINRPESERVKELKGQVTADTPAGWGGCVGMDSAGRNWCTDIDINRGIDIDRGFPGGNPDPNTPIISFADRARLTAGGYV